MGAMKVNEGAITSWPAKLPQFLNQSGAEVPFTHATAYLLPTKSAIRVSNNSTYLPRGYPF